jgi:hypothetical protein
MQLACTRSLSSSSKIFSARQGGKQQQRAHGVRNAQRASHHFLKRRTRILVSLGVEIGVHLVCINARLIAATSLPHKSARRQARAHCACRSSHTRREGGGSRRCPHTGVLLADLLGIGELYSDCKQAGPGRLVRRVLRNAQSTGEF